MVEKTVTIKSFNENEISHFEDCQGVVIFEWEDFYVVQLEKCFHYLLGHPVVWDDKELPYGQIRVLKEDVKEEDLRVEVKVKSLFGKVWDIYTLKNSFNKDDICSYEGCNEKVKRRILVNCWGVAYEYDCCESHAEQLHGKSLDIFPGKKEGRCL